MHQTTFRWMARLATAMLTLAAGTAGAEVATPDEASRLLDGALAEIRAQGLEKAIQGFNAGGRWKQERAYLVAVQLDGKVLANSANGKLPGHNMLEARDANGRLFIQQAIQVARTSGSGQVDLRWGHPATRRLSDATMFVRRVPGQDVYIGTLVFK